MRRAGDMFGLMRAFQKCGKSVVAYQFGGMMAPTGLFNQLTCVCCKSRKRKHLIWASAREEWKWKTHSNHRDKCVKQKIRVLSWFLVFQRMPGQIRSAKPPNNGAFRTVLGCWRWTDPFLSQCLGVCVCVGWYRVARFTAHRGAGLLCGRFVLGPTVVLVCYVAVSFRGSPWCWSE